MRKSRVILTGLIFALGLANLTNAATSRGGRNFSGEHSHTFSVGYSGERSNEKGTVTHEGATSNQPGVFFHEGRTTITTVNGSTMTHDGTFSKEDSVMTQHQASTKISNNDKTSSLSRYVNTIVHQNDGSIDHEANNQVNVTREIS